jgi:hypothetical protein
MKIAFFTDYLLPNYLTSPSSYEYLHGKHSSTGYYYWLLKNGGIPNVNLISDKAAVKNYDVVIFHYDDKDSLDEYTGLKIQVVTDRPVVPNCNLYIAANQTFETKVMSLEVIARYGIENTLNTWINKGQVWHFIHYPPTFGVKQCNPTFPPKIFKYVGREHTNIPDIYEESFKEKCKGYNIDLQFDFQNDGNNGTEDVYFCARKVEHKSKAAGVNNNSGKYGHRTANRLWQSWYMRTPGVFNLSPEMEAIRTSNLDYLVANSAEELLHQFLLLKSNKELFFSMIENGISKDYTNPYCNPDIVVQQWKEAFSKLNIDYV